MSIRSQQTLKGVFPQPKVQPKRDFLRENKLKLKDLQRHIVNRKQLENEIIERNCNRLKYKQNYKSLDNKEFCEATSNTEAKTNKCNTIHVKKLNSPCCCHGPLVSCCRISPHCCHNLDDEQISTHRHVDHRIVAHKEIQTDDIYDEEYLNDALKKCLSRTDMDDDDNETLNIPPNSLELDQNFYLSSRTFKQQMYDKYPSCNGLDVEERPMTNQTQTTQTTINQPTIKRKPNKLLGVLDSSNRGDIKLPKYLEREIRERQLRKIREMEKDPECPDGHQLLGEQEKEDAIKQYQKKFKDLIGELNRLPMTSETLRTRTRKNQIEKELIELENNIRNFSKQKVYVKVNE